jgi:two-component system response regulator DesR
MCLNTSQAFLTHFGADHCADIAGGRGVVRVLLAMPGGLLRGALRYVLSAQPDIDVIAELDAVEDAIKFIRTDVPDVVVLDLDLLSAGPVVDATRAAHEAQFEMPETRVLVLVDPRRPGFGSQLAGIPPTVGFLAQTAPPERVVEAVRRLALGKPVVDADLVVAALTAQTPLTRRELWVLQVAASGMPVKEIATNLSMSPGTVRNHLSRIMAKTGARNRIEAIHIAQQAGWI